MEERADSDIVKQVVGGKKNLYRFIVDKYKNPVFSLMMRATGSRQDAEEMTQETFMKAYAALHRFNTEKNFFPWLYTIGLNITRDWKRKVLSQPWPSVESGERFLTDGNDLGQEAIVTRKQDMAQVQKGLSMISPEYREAVVLRFRYELSIREISEVFNISMSATKMRVHRGLQQLKEKVCHENNA